MALLGLLQLVALACVAARDAPAARATGRCQQVHTARAFLAAIKKAKPSQDVNICVLGSSR